MFICLAKIFPQLWEFLMSKSGTPKAKTLAIIAYTLARNYHQNLGENSSHKAGKNSQDLGSAKVVNLI
jgi:hypothetical protein